MHSPLFIDELLREIFFHCYESDRSTLTSAARTCKAWRDPALDALWKRLPSIGPLLLLLPGIALKDEEYIYTSCSLHLDLGLFKKYACRVKHISNRQSLRIHPTAAAVLPLVWSRGPSIPNLATTHISIPRCNPAVIPLNLSPNLIHLDIDLGFKKQPSDDETIVHKFLDQVVHECPELRSVGFRGLAFQHINQTISTMQNLQSLSLRLGGSLLPETLHAVMGFPHLLDLEVHAGHIKLQDTLQQQCQPLPHGTFAVLQKLHIRAQSSSIEDILHFVQPNTLRHLLIELDDTSASSTLWSTIFERICSKAANSLLHLTLEHHFEVLEPPSSVATNATQQAQQGHHAPNAPNPSVSFEAFRMLASLKHLRHFACDLTVPPVILDDEFEKLVESWPNLEHLELGPIPDFLDEDFNFLLTPGIFPSVATMAPKLERLILPLIIDEDLPAIFPLTQIYSSNRLHNLTVARLNTSRPVQVGDFLSRLFPSLDVVEGPSDDVHPWIDVNAALQKHCLQ